VCGVRGDARVLLGCRLRGHHRLRVSAGASRGRAAQDGGWRGDRQDPPPAVTGLVEQGADPGAIWRIINGFGAYFSTVAAVRLGVFDALVARPLDAAGLATACAADESRLRVLCDALVALGLLGRVDEMFELTGTSDAFLTARGPRSMRDLVLSSPG